MEKIILGAIAISFSTICLSEEPKISNEKFTISGNAIEGGVTHHIQTWMADSNETSSNVSSNSSQKIHK